MSEATFNPAKRRLCPDGACIGVIGDDGRCRVCGASASGAAPIGDLPGHLTGASAPFGGADDEVAADLDPAAEGTPDQGVSAGPDAGGSDAMSAEGATPGASGAGFRPDRRLCDDGSCIGVVGADGLCNVCGRRAGH